MSIAVIWDLDGTLLDSYDVIVESIYRVFQEIGYPMSRGEVRERALRTSTSELFQEAFARTGIPVEQLADRYRYFSKSTCHLIKRMDGAYKLLSALQQRGIKNYVYTHRGVTTIPVLDHLQMTDFFQEILTSRSGFARKPDPEALVYLMDKYALDPKHTYYVGDRRLDIDCANNAGIYSVLFRREGDIDVATGAEDYIISDLMDFLTII